VRASGKPRFQDFREWAVKDSDTPLIGMFPSSRYHRGMHRTRTRGHVRVFEFASTADCRDGQGRTAR
jgi:hypothetical protein